jgi:hypothetical protein
MMTMFARTFRRPALSRREGLSLRSSRPQQT